MPFEAMAETLLKGGVAPRHVRRYVRELDDHLGDLTERQREAGYDGDDARLRARARLGDDRELAAAMLNQPGLRSWPARLPWLVFVALPPVVAVLAIMPVFTLFYFIGDSADRISAVTAIPSGWLRGVAQLVLAAINVLAVPAIVTLFAILARRQRLGLLWPLLGIVLLALLMPQFGYQFGQPFIKHSGSVSVDMGLTFMHQAWDHALHHWPTVTAQYVLAALPVLWLLHARRA
ncbi:MAG TPA: hypothetical protein VGM26_05630 [Rhizomicrobium sp.]|jgi:hypothetical protein